MVKEKGVGMGASFKRESVPSRDYQGAVSINRAVKPLTHGCGSDRDVAANWTLDDFPATITGLAAIYEIFGRKRMFDTRFVLPLAQVGPTATAPANAPVTAAPSITAGPADVSMAPTATTTAPGVATTTEAPKASPSSPLPQILMIGAMLVVLYFVMFRGQKKTEKARKLMIEQMKKGDKVMTVGGLVARIVSMEDDEVVLKIDESANVKATYKKSSIQQVLDRDEKTK
jgi:preprotein translocase subunit YajC